MKKLIQALLFFVLLTGSAWTVNAQVTNPSTYDLEFGNAQLSCDGTSFCVDINIKAASGASNFAAGSHTVYFNYNKGAINNPTYTAIDFSTNTMCSDGAGGNYAPYILTNFDSFELGAMGEANFTTQLGSFMTGLECPVVSNTFVPMGKVCFTVVDNAQTTNLTFDSNLTLINLSTDLPAHTQGTFSPLDMGLTLSPPTASISNTSNVTCNGAASGTATAQGSGGAGGYTYVWSNMETTASIIDLGIGTYTVTVTDSGGCTATATTTIIEPTALSLSVVSTSNASAGGSDGTATVSAAGGTGNYTYIWSNMAMGASISGLAAGNYMVTVTDANMCSATLTVTIVENVPTLSVSITNTSDVSCNGGMDGTAMAQATGGSVGTGNYTYVWSDMTMGASVSGLSAGVYTVTVSDVTGATAMASATITEPSALTLSLVSTSNASVGASDGTANVSAAGGTGNYTYIWSNMAMGASISGLAAGNYMVTVTDANMCSATLTVTIVENVPTLSVSITNTSDVSCNGGMDGTAMAQATGGLVGTGNYTYVWSDMTMGASVSGLSAGVYTVTVSDVTGATAMASATITEPSALTLSLVSTTNASVGASDGTASVSAAGGTGNYTYIWSNMAMGASISGLAAGNYMVTVTDANMCSATLTVTIVENVPILSVSITNTSDVSCNGGMDGTAMAQATGGAVGTGSYTYVWSDMTMGASVSGLSAGVYTVTVTDVTGATASASATITEPSVISVIPNVVLPTCVGYDDASITIMATGGTGTYTYLWGTGETNNSIDNLFAGMYVVTVTDMSGCSAVQNITVTENDNNCLVVDLITFLQGSYDPSTGLMATALNTGAALPTNQPYDIAPWNYTGMEYVPAGAALATNAVDWVLVELRDGTDPEQIVGTRAGVLLDDGTVIDALGNAGVRFPNIDQTLSYQIVVRHRNHVDLITATPELPQVLYDFSNPANVLDGANQLILLDPTNNLHGMRSGDVDGNGVVNVDDFNIFVGQAGIVNGYSESDLNMDGAVTVTDYNIYQANATVIGVLLIRY